MKRMRRSLIIIGACMILAITSCTAIRDTTPCNASKLLDLREKKALSSEEKVILDSLEQRCAQYEATPRDTSLEPQENISFWIRGAIIVVGSLLVLYLSGVFD
jgi:hypothetical protein